MIGTIKTLVRAKGYGFIRGADAHEYFFHQSAVDDFSALHEGDTVQFVPGKSAKGPRAEDLSKENA